MAPQPDRASTRLEVFVGRSIALCVHPYAAWRRPSAKNRILVFVAYMAAGYAVVLAALELLSV